MKDKTTVKRKLVKAVCTALIFTASCMVLTACQSDRGVSASSAPNSEKSVSAIEVNTNDSGSEYYAEKIEGSYDYTIFKFSKDYEFSSQEGIDTIAYIGLTPDDKYDNCISIYAGGQSIEAVAETEMKDAELSGYAKVQKLGANSEIPLEHERIIASQPEGEGVIENSEKEIYIFKHGENSLVVCVNYTTQTKNNIYPYLIAMVKTIDLK